MTPTDIIKKRLREVWYYSHAIDSDLDKIAMLRSQAERMTPAYSLAPGGHPSANMADAVEMIVCIQDKMRIHIRKMHDAQIMAEAMIDSLPDFRQRSAMQYRYINFYSWNRVARKMNYSVQQVWKLHGQALDYLSKNSGLKE